MSTNIIKKKPDYFDGIKKFTNYLVKKKFNINDLKYVIEKYKIDASIIRRLITYVCSSPHILIYLNKHLNKLGGNYNLIDFCLAYRYILESNNMLDTRNFLYIKANDQKNNLQELLVKLFGDYFKQIHNIHYNYHELLFFYNLYLFGVISNHEINEIDKLLNNNVSTIKLHDFIEQKNDNEITISIQDAIRQIKSVTKDIDNINTQIHELKLKNCRQCNFFNNTLVPIDGNSVNNLDVLIINICSSLEDAKNKKIFSKENSIVRKNIENFKNLNWVLLNLIPCCFKSKSEIGSIEDLKNQVTLCRKNIINIILEKFNYKYCILIGEEVSNQFVDKPFDSIIGKLENNKFLAVPHPNSMRNPTAKIRGEGVWKTVQEIIHIKQNECIDEIVEEKTISPPKTEEKISRKISKDESLLLLDIKEMNDGSIMMVYTDQSGNKIYKKIKNHQVGFIKESNFSECSIITDSVDYIFDMTKEQKFQLSKLLREKLNMLKRS